MKPILRQSSFGHHQSSEWETFQPLGSLGLLGCVCLSLALPSCCPPCSCYHSLSSPSPVQSLFPRSSVSLSAGSFSQPFFTWERNKRLYTPSLGSFLHSKQQWFPQTGCSPLRNHSSTSFTEEDRSVPARSVQPRRRLQGQYEHRWENPDPTPLHY